MGINKGYLTAGRTKESDECLTPRYAVEPIVKHLKAKGYNNIWCPFDNDTSWFVRVLKKEGFIVFNTHKDTLLGGQYDGDFFNVINELLPHTSFDCIVSNPPFSIKDKILERLYDLDIPFMMLLPQNSLQSQKRVNMFMKNGLEYLGFDKRVCFYTCGDLSRIKFGNHFASGYFCKGVLKEKMMFEKLTEIQEPYL